MDCKSWCLRTAVALAIVAAGLPSARAAVVNFSFDEPELANVYFPLEEIAIGDYRLMFLDTGLIGTAGDLPASTAPLGNPTQFATALNSGGLFLYRFDYEPFDLLSFDFAYVPHPNSPPPLHDLALIIGGATSLVPRDWRVDPAVMNHSFVRYDDPAEMASYRGVTILTFLLCDYDPTTLAVCNFPLETAAQFALDNIRVLDGISAPVPEPATNWLFAAGLGALLLRRRQPARHAASARIDLSAA